MISTAPMPVCPCPPTPWTPEHIAQLTQTWTTDVPLSDIARALGRTPVAISRKAAKLGLRRPQRNRPWTAHELQHLAHAWQNNATLGQIARELNRTPLAVAKKVEKLKLRRSHPLVRDARGELIPRDRFWSEAQSRELCILYKDHGLSIAELGEHFGRTKKATAHKLARLGCTRAKAAAFTLPEIPRRPWQEKDSEHLTNYWRLKTLGVEDIAIFLNRPLPDILLRARELGLPKKPIKTPSTKYEINHKWNVSAHTVREVLTSTEQHALAELSAIRLNQLRVDNPGAEEINRIFEIHRAIFSPTIHTQATKLASRNPQTLSREELIQIGEITLYQCLCKWRPQDGMNFSRSMIASILTKEMRRAIQRDRLVHLPSGLINDILQERRRYYQPDADPPPRYTRNRQHAIETYRYSVQSPSTIPLAETIDEDDDCPAPQLAIGWDYAQNAATPQTQSPTYSLPEIETEDTLKFLARLLEEVPPVERYAFSQYYGIGPNGEEIPHQNLREISQKTGVTKERVRQRIAIARQHLIKHLQKAGIYHARQLCPS